jgi:hypothetical protein
MRAAPKVARAVAASLFVCVFARTGEAECIDLSGVQALEVRGRLEFKFSRVRRISPMCEKATLQNRPTSFNFLTRFA